MDEMMTRSQALVIRFGGSLEGMTTWPSCPSVHGVLSVLAYLPLRGRTVLRDSRAQDYDRERPTSNIRCGEAIIIICPKEPCLDLQ